MTEMGATTLDANSSFRGPLFLVGMPRSGTKLLRGVLQKHPRVEFSPIETEFFPYWVDQWQRIGPTEDPASFEQFYRACRGLPFFIQNTERGIEVDCAEWRRRCTSLEPAPVFEALMRTILDLPGRDSTTIWGDKSPSYVRHVPLLLEQFPAGCIIHIIRDVRDCALSIHEAWGKSMLRAAQRWQDDVSKCHEDGMADPARFLEVRYEDILTNPRESLGKVCEFIGVQFDEGMLTPGATIERKMKERGISTVLTSNTGRYRETMSSRLIGKIERISCASLRRLNYECAYSGSPVRLSSWRMRVLQVKDAMVVLRSSFADRGLLGALKFQIRYFRTSGNRF